MQPRQRQRQTNNNSMTTCHKGGVKIKDTGNGYKADQFEGINKFNVQTEEKGIPLLYDKNSYEKLDLNI